MTTNTKTCFHWKQRRTAEVYVTLVKQHDFTAFDPSAQLARPLMVVLAGGVDHHSLGVYTNLIHPDAAERKANLAYFETMMKIAGQMGVGTLITEAGHEWPLVKAAIIAGAAFPVAAAVGDFYEATARLKSRHK